MGLDSATLTIVLIPSLPLPVAPSFPLTPPESLPQDSTKQHPVRYAVIIILALSGGGGLL